MITHSAATPLYGKAHHHSCKVPAYQMGKYILNVHFISKYTFDSWLVSRTYKQLKYLTSRKEAN